MNTRILGAVAIGAAASLVACSDSGSNSKALTGPQTGAATVDLTGADTVSFTQPSQIGLSGTATYDDVGDAVTISLTLKNSSKTVLHNPKVLVSALSEGAVVGDGSFPSPAEGGGTDYVLFGPESVPPGGSTSRDVDFSGVTGVGTELTMDLEVVVHAWAFVPGNDDGVIATDISGTGEELDLFDIEIEGFGWDGDSWMRADTMSPDTRYIYYTNRNQPAVLMFDTVDQTLTIGDSLIGGTIAYDGTGVVGCIDGLSASPDGKSLYATISHDAHIATFDGDYPVPSLIEVVRLDAKSLGVKDRLTIWEPPLPGPEGGGPPYEQDIRGRRMAISTGGSYGAVSVTGSGEVMMINLGSLSIMDTWSVPGFYSPRHVAINADGSTIACGFTWRDDNNGTLQMIDTATGTITPMAPPTVDPGTNAYIGFLEYGPDDRLYYGRPWDGSIPGVSIYDPVGASWTEITGYGNSISFGADDWCIYDDSASELRCFDYTDVEQTFPATGTTGIPITVGTWGHGLVITR